MHLTQPVTHLCFLLLCCILSFLSVPLCIPHFQFLFPSHLGALTFCYLFSPTLTYPNLLFHKVHPFTEFWGSHCPWSTCMVTTFSFVGDCCIQLLNALLLGLVLQNPSPKNTWKNLQYKNLALSVINKGLGYSSWRLNECYQNFTTY